MTTMKEMMMLQRWRIEIDEGVVGVERLEHGVCDANVNVKLIRK